MKQCFGFILLCGLDVSDTFYPLSFKCGTCKYSRATLVASGTVGTGNSNLDGIRESIKYQSVPNVPLPYPKLVRVVYAFLLTKQIFWESLLPSGMAHIVLSVPAQDVLIVKLE